MSYPKITPITPEEYQDTLAKIQKSFPVYGTPMCLPSYITGLAEETGEVCGIIKRVFREGEEPNLEKLEKELGDVIAYTVLIGWFYGINFEDILLTNLQKLQKRKEAGTLHGSGDNR